MMAFLQFPTTLFHVVGEIGWVRQLMQVAADSGLGFILFGPGHGVETRFALRHIGVAAKEIHAPGSEPEQRGHPGIVVIFFRQVTISAAFGGSNSAGRVREVGIVCLAAVPFGAYGLLL